MRRVFDGGEGLIKGGIADRSKDSGVLVLWDAGLNGGDEVGGEFVSVGIVSGLPDWFPRFPRGIQTQKLCVHKRKVPGKGEALF